MGKHRSDWVNLDFLDLFESAQVNMEHLDVKQCQPLVRLDQFGSVWTSLRSASVGVDRPWTARIKQDLLR